MTSSRPNLIARLAARVRALRAARSEDGFVMVVVLCMLTVAIGFGAAALAETLSSRTYANHDMRAKRAVSAADAGVQALLYQQNQLPLKNLEFNGGPLSVGTFLDCVVPTLDINLKITGVTTDSVDSAGVCPVATGPGATGTNGGSTKIPVGDHGWYQAKFIPGVTNPGGGPHRVVNAKIVSVGFDDNGNSSTTSGYVLRRVEAVLAPLDPFQAVESMGNLTYNGAGTTCVILLGCTNVVGAINGNIRTDGDLTLPLLGANINATQGLLGTASYAGTLHGSLLTLPAPTHLTAPFARSTISVAASKLDCVLAGTATNNCSGLGGAYNASTDSVSLSSGTLNIAPGDYVLCNFSATGSAAVNAQATTSAPVRIFIDSPKSDRCKNVVPTPNGNFTASNGVTNILSGLANATGASGVQIYVVGDQGTPAYDNGTTVNIGGLGAIQSFVVYAPTSRVTVNNCLNVNVGILSESLCLPFSGAIIGDDVTIGASVLTQDLDLSSYSLYSGLGAFHVQNYVECTPVYPLPTPDPTAGC